ncbi:uncharacterized protein Dyak_GE27791 [Drosophila yakuba]|uniref:Uncharacterized protein n=1 Tax=Drosophila yakuba TaxID=7245 RepID=A0A0R1E4R5_DROYA|nr:uncharacterized protein Dyak_GE27791 [Drosophila yakuba]
MHGHRTLRNLSTSASPVLHTGVHEYSQVRHTTKLSDAAAQLLKDGPLSQSQSLH